MATATDKANVLILEKWEDDTQKRDKKKSSVKVNKKALVWVENIGEKDIRLRNPTFTLKRGGRVEKRLIPKEVLKSEKFKKLHLDGKIKDFVPDAPKLDEKGRAERMNSSLRMTKDRNINDLMQMEDPPSEISMMTEKLWQELRKEIFTSSMPDGNLAVSNEQAERMIKNVILKTIDKCLSGISDKIKPFIFNLIWKNIEVIATKEANYLKNSILYVDSPSKKIQDSLK